MDEAIKKGLIRYKKVKKKPLTITDEDERRFEGITFQRVASSYAALSKGDLIQQITVVQTDKPMVTVLTQKCPQGRVINLKELLDHYNIINNL